MAATAPTERHDRILVVHDSKSTLDDIVNFLKRNAVWRVETAVTYSEAKDAFERSLHQGDPFAIFITDMHLVGDEDKGIKPDDAGLKLLKWARETSPSSMGIAITGVRERLEQLAGLPPLARLQTYQAGAIAAYEVSLNWTESLEVQLKIALATAVRLREAASELNWKSRFSDERVYRAYSNNPDSVGLHAKNVAIAFWDIQGFSGLTAKTLRKPAKVTDLLKDYYDAATTAIQAHAGILDKFIGDGVMAVFGYFDEDSNADVYSNWPEEHSRAKRATARAAQAAARAALDLKLHFDRIVKIHQNKFGTQSFEIGLKRRNDKGKIVKAPDKVGLRCGIDGGSALVGVTGTQARDHFTAFGHEVNRANRLEGEAWRSRVGILMTADLKMEIESLAERDPSVIFGKERRFNNIKGHEGDLIRAFDVLRGGVSNPV